jgi:hypothetical protein
MCGPDQVKAISLSALGGALVLDRAICGIGVTCGWFLRQMAVLGLSFWLICAIIQTKRPPCCL